MRSKLSDLVNNLPEINNKVCKWCMERKSIKLMCDFICFKDNKLNYRCKECKETSTKTINGLVEKFRNGYQFYIGDLNKCFLLLRKCVYPYEDMNSWEKCYENSLPDKKYFYSELNLERITDKGYAHDQKVWVVLQIRNHGQYHDFYVESDTLLLADVFEKFRDTCIER